MDSFTNLGCIMALPVRAAERRLGEDGAIWTSWGGAIWRCVLCGECRQASDRCERVRVFACMCMCGCAGSCVRARACICVCARMCVCARRRVCARVWNGTEERASSGPACPTGTRGRDATLLWTGHGTYSAGHPVPAMRERH